MANRIRQGDEPADFPSAQLFRLQKVSQLTEQTLLPPRKKRAPHQPEAHVVIEIPEELKRQLREKNLERLKKTITRDKVREYVYKRLRNREHMGIEKLAPATLEEFIYLTYVYLYGYDGLAGYRLIRGEENRIIAVGDYRFQ
ncbi:MAG: DUF5716 family protein [Firmicutes bacterium]|nr:DUF5716 family protein [Bacillota bacterium]